MTFAHVTTAIGLALALAAPLESQRLPRVLISTSLGDIEVEIDTVRAPISGANFLRHVDSAYYDGGRFFRTVRVENQPDTIQPRIQVIQVNANGARGRGFPPIPLERTSVTDAGAAHRDHECETRPLTERPAPRAADAPAVPST